MDPVERESRDAARRMAAENRAQAARVAPPSSATTAPPPPPPLGATIIRLIEQPPFVPGHGGLACTEPNHAEARARLIVTAIQFEQLIKLEAPNVTIAELAEADPRDTAIPDRDAIFISAIDRYTLRIKLPLRNKASIKTFLGDSVVLRHAAYALGLHLHVHAPKAAEFATNAIARWRTGYSDGAPHGPAQLVALGVLPRDWATSWRPHANQWWPLDASVLAMFAPAAAAMRRAEEATLKAVVAASTATARRELLARSAAARGAGGRTTAADFEDENPRRVLVANSEPSASNGERMATRDTARPVVDAAQHGGAVAALPPVHRADLVMAEDIAIASSMAGFPYVAGLARLVDMGFDVEASRRALIATGGDLEAALPMLMVSGA